ncbi:MAG: STAS domain-containing protein [Acidimicrobiales bacterium]
MARSSESLEDSALPSAAVRLRQPPFSVEVFTIDSNVQVVVVHGEVDMVTAPELSEVVGEVLERFPRMLVFDLSDVSFMDSSGIKVVLYARRGMPARCSVVLHRPQPIVREVLKITRMDELCVIEDYGPRSGAGFGEASEG